MQAAARGIEEHGDGPQPRQRDAHGPQGRPHERLQEPGRLSRAVHHAEAAEDLSEGLSRGAREVSGVGEAAARGEQIPAWPVSTFAE